MLWSMEEFPAPEAYGRVSDPDRYVVLQQAADVLLNRLAEEYVVQRTEGVDVDQDLARRAGVRRVVRLSPRPREGAPLTVAFTTFPGVLVRYGRWYVEEYPRCGCDACDEQAQALTREMTDRVDTLVAGGFSEELKRWLRPALRFRFASRTDQSSAAGEVRLRRAQARALGRSTRCGWPAWQKR